MGLLPLIVALGLLPAATPGCTSLPARAPAGLPAPVDLAGKCGRVRVLRSGRILRLPIAPARRPPAAFFPGNGTVVDSRRGHLVFLRAGEVVWRSEGRYRLYRTPHYLANAALGEADAADAARQPCAPHLVLHVTSSGRRYWFVEAISPEAVGAEPHRAESRLLPER